MLIPPVSDETEALQLIESVTQDARVLSLLEIFTNSSELLRLAKHVERSSAVLNEAEQKQAMAIVQSWRSGVDADYLRTNSGLERLKAKAAKWDFRLGRERDSIPTSPDLLPHDIAELVEGLASDWGMKSGRPISGHYQVVAAMGGLVRANIARPATAAALILDGTITADCVLGLAGERSTSRLERNLALDMGVPPDSEQDALRFGLERAFKLDPNLWSPRTDAPSLFENVAGTLPIIFGAAPRISGTGRRATTGEAFEWLLQLFEMPPNSSVLQITTNIYWIANQIALRTNAPRRMRVSTIGQRESLHGGPVQQFRAQHYLQELKAVLDYLPKLEQWVMAAEVQG